MKAELPADFDPAEYLALNPDVKEIGVDPEIHFLTYGQQENRKYRLKDLVIAIGAIVKDEAPYILEWIAHHMILGVDKFIIADNSSTDGTKEMLAKLSHAGIIKLIHFHGQVGHPPQMPAYSEILRNSEGIDWLGFIDADEFIITSPEIKLKTLISNLSQNTKIGAIAINWSVYGSSNQIHKTPGLVVERFKNRALQTFPVNKHYKSLLRLRSLNKVLSNPHYFELKPGQNYVHSNGVLVMDIAALGKGLSQYVIWEPMRLNHYVIKSKDEFNLRSKKNSPRRLNYNIKNEAYFQDHDRNDVLAEFDHEWTNEIKRKITYLDSISLAGEIYTLRKNEGESGWIDSIQIDKEFLRIKGWSYLMSEMGQEKITLIFSDNKVEIISVLPLKREDVTSHINGMSPFCGFEITCSSKEIPLYDLEIIKKIQLEIKVGNEFEILNLNKKITESRLGLTFPKLLKDFYIQHALGSRLIVEYGSGSSTFFCALNGISSISVESDLNFLNYLKDEINFFTSNNQITLVHADIGNTKALGFPENDSSIRQFPRYASLPWTISSKNEIDPDLVLIDGRFRVACMLATMANVRKPTKVIFDDYVGRNYDQTIEQFVKPVRTIDRAAFFEIYPGTISSKNLLDCIDKFFDPS